jgi:hypothetical protein
MQKIKKVYSKATFFIMAVAHGSTLDSQNYLEPKTLNIPRYTNTQNSLAKPAENTHTLTLISILPLHCLYHA